MNKPVKTIPCEHGVVIKVYQDPEPQNPNDYDGDCCFLWSDDRDLCLIERKDGKSTGRIKGVSKGDLMRDEDDDQSVSSEYAIFPTEVGYRGYALGCLLADISHDNNAIEHWHSFILVRRADFPPDHDLRAAAKACFDEWNTYLGGDVYGYVIEDAEGEELASLWGLYGLDYAIEQAREAAESHMPVARGRALVRKLADATQRMVATASDIDRCADRVRVCACRVVFEATRCGPDRNISDLDAALNNMHRDRQACIRETAATLNGSVPAAQVYTEWLWRYWPGE